MKSSLNFLESTVKERMSALERTAHSYAHVDRLAKDCYNSSSKRESRHRTCPDNRPPTQHWQNHRRTLNETGAKLASEILKQSATCPQERIERVAKIVINHPIAFRNKLQTLEEKIVWDADKIDLLGVVGIARVFHWLGRKPFEAAVDTCFEELKPI